MPYRHQNFNNNNHHHHQQHHHFNRNPNTDRGGGGAPHLHQQHHQFNPPPQDHNFGARDGFQPMSDGDGHAMALSGGKRPFPFSGRGDNADNVAYAKLYVGSIPKRATENDIRPLFEEHGKVVEVIFIKDKWTGQQQGYCFVKYETLEEADRAIQALHSRYTLPGEFRPIVVRYADEKREYLPNYPSVGVADTKLYVAGLNKQATEKEIEEIFSPYGCVEDIHIMRIEMKQSRGSGFVRFSQKDMAVAAINALSGTYVMKGCELPLTVRFAERKRPKAGEFRQDSSHGDPTAWNFQPNAWWKTNAQDWPPSSQAHDFASNSLAKADAAPVPRMEISPTAAQHNVLNTQAEDEPSIPCQQKASQEECNQPSEKSLEQLLSETPIPMQQEVATSSSSSSVLHPRSWEEGAHPICEWSEHICPDGVNYYYNCITKESRWERPEEVAIFKLQPHKQPTATASMKISTTSVSNSCEVGS